MVKAPFPYFGGKARVAGHVWQRFGAVPNYVEAFFGSGAVLLGRPHAPQLETVNDADGYVANFWRALQADPDAVAHYADWPVNENDQHARHLWLITKGAEHVERLNTEPDYYDAKVAGWWVWGMGTWIGSGWCQLPHLGNEGMGVCELKGGALRSYLRALADRLRNVRVCCGDWSRVMGPSVTHKHGLTAVFLDPPYGDVGRQSGLYGTDSLTVAASVRLWCLENGNNPLLRIALCGYEDEHDMPGWSLWRWKAQGGFGSQGEGAGRENAKRECVWFSPHCLSTDLFTAMGVSV